MSRPAVMPFDDDMPAGKAMDPAADVAVAGHKGRGEKGNLDTVEIIQNSQVDKAVASARIRGHLGIVSPLV